MPTNRPRKRDNRGLVNHVLLVETTWLVTRDPEFMVYILYIYVDSVVFPCDLSPSVADPWRKKRNRVVARGRAIAIVIGSGATRRASSASVVMVMIVARH